MMSHDADSWPRYPRGYMILMNFVYSRALHVTKEDIMYDVDKYEDLLFRIIQNINYRLEDDDPLLPRGWTDWKISK